VSAGNLVSKKVDVLIATPGRNMHVEYVKSLVKTCAALDEAGISYAYLSRYSSLVSSAREKTAVNSDSNLYGGTTLIASGEYEYKKIFWIDSDISWEPNQFMRLYESEHDVISGVYQTGTDGTVAVTIFDGNGTPTYVNKTKIFEHSEPLIVDGVGFGFVAMKSGVFENIPRPWFSTVKVQFVNVPYQVDMGEDYSWCMRAREAGHDVWLDPMIHVAHHKETVYLI
jgi:hypothetical protein